MPKERATTNCLYCNKAIATGRIDKRHCNRFCQRQAELARSRAKWAKIKAERPTAPPRLCERCGKMIDFEDARPSAVTRKKYCSEKCGNAAHGERFMKRRRERIAETIHQSGIPLERECAFCGKSFVLKPETPKQGHVCIRRIYCSEKCGNQAVQTRRDWVKEYQKRREDMLAHLENKRREAGIPPIGTTPTRPHREILALYKLAFPECDVLCNHPVLTNPNTNRKLRFDIWIPEKQIAIEVDGPHHRNPIWGQEYLLYIQKMDALKDRLAAEAGIHLIRIPVE